MRRLVLGIAVAVTSLMPVVGMADDQQIAEYVKSRLKTEQDAGNLKGFNVDMRVDGGTVWFEGFVSSPQQQMTILRTAQQAGHLGVVQVVDDIEVRGSNPYQAAPAAYQAYDRPAPVQSASYRAPVAQTRVARRAPIVRRAPRRAPVVPYAPSQEYIESYNEPLPFAACENCAGGGVPFDNGSFGGGEIIEGSFGDSYVNSYGDPYGGAPLASNYGGGQPLAAPRRAPVVPYAPSQEYIESYNEPLPFAACENCAGGGVPFDNGSFGGGEIIEGSFGDSYVNSYGDPYGGAPLASNYGGGQPLAAGFADGSGGGGGAGASGPANLPGYAWPSYAAAPNYGAVSYPRQHSASAWPYIGPFYPYPQVPLGWRKVTLEWDDGWWNLDFHDK